MPLFTDADVITLNDLLPFESSLVQVASTHSINVETKINLAVNSIGEKLLVWLLNIGASDPQFLNRRLLGLSTVVVTAPLHDWLCFESLSRFFSEAYNVQLNTRFQGKWTEYQNASKDVADLFFMSGAGIVYQPLPKPVMPDAAVQSGTTNVGSLFIQTAWVNSQGNESALSPINGLILDSPSLVSIQMDNNSPIPSSAIGWNVYASTTSDNLTRQNSVPVPIGVAWQLPASGVILGVQPGSGQNPDYYINLSRQILRG